MAKKPNVLGRFSLGIAVIENEEKTITWDCKYVNEMVPLEIVITYIKALLQEQEEEYLKGYKSGTPGSINRDPNDGYEE